MRTIIKKELLGHLQGVQFILLFGVSFLLFSANSLTLSKRFSQEVSLYSMKKNAQHQNPSTARIQLCRPPSLLLFIAEGGEKFLPQTFWLQPKSRLEPRIRDRNNNKMPEMPEIDWSLVIKLVFSLYAVLLGYDAVAGEKEQGTLRLCLSNPISRVKFLAAKGVSILLTLLIPLTCGMMISVLIMGISNPQVFAAPNIVRILIMFVLAVAFLSIFISLSILISSLVSRSSISLFLLMAIWMLMAVIIPNLSGVFAQPLAKVPSESQFTETFRLIDLRANEKVNGEINNFLKGKITSEEDLRKKSDLIFNEAKEEYIKQEDAYLRALRKQSEIARSITRISPVGLFQYAAEGIALTGGSSVDWFLKTVKGYSKNYDQYVMGKVGKLLFKCLDQRMGSGYQSLGKYILLNPPSAPEYKGDMSDFPWFTDTPPSLTESLKSALFDLAGLLVWNIVLMILAFGAFLKADVR